MLSIPLLSILLIVFILIIFSIFKRSSPTKIEEEPALFVMFDEPFFIEPHKLVELISGLALGTDASTTRELYLHGDPEATPKISFEKYFSMYGYKCTITKTEVVNKETIKLFLRFDRKK